MHSYDSASVYSLCVQRTIGTGDRVVKSLLTSIALVDVFKSYSLTRFAPLAASMVRVHLIDHQHSFIYMTTCAAPLS